ncbi:MAG: hypothetical protein U0791_23420 [Gemmataceae bacterium]
MVMLMAEKPLKSDEEADSLTTVKCYKSFARVLGKLAKLKGNSVQDELQWRVKDFEDELLKELAREKLEIEQSRRDSRK